MLTQNNTKRENLTLKKLCGLGNLLEKKKQILLNSDSWLLIWTANTIISDGSY